MRPDRVEVTPPAFDDDLSLAQRVEDFTVEQFIAKACVEALDVPVLPRAAWRDVDGLCPDRCDPLLHTRCLSARWCVRRATAVLVSRPGCHHRDRSGPHSPWYYEGEGSPRPAAHELRRGA